MEEEQERDGPCMRVCVPEEVTAHTPRLVITSKHQHHLTLTVFSQVCIAKTHT